MLGNVTSLLSIIGGWTLTAAGVSYPIEELLQREIPSVWSGWLSSRFLPMTPMQCFVLIFPTVSWLTASARSKAAFLQGTWVSRGVIASLPTHPPSNLPLSVFVPGFFMRRGEVFWPHLLFLGYVKSILTLSGPVLITKCGKVGRISPSAYRPAYFYKRSQALVSEQPYRTLTLKSTYLQLDSWSTFAL